MTRYWVRGPQKGEIVRREKLLHGTGGLLKTESRHLFAKDEGVRFQDLADGVFGRDSSVLGRETGGRVGRGPPEVAG